MAGLANPPIHVTVAVVGDTPTRFVLGTYPAKGGIRKFLLGSSLPDRSVPPIEAWDFDWTAGVLTVLPPEGTPNGQKPAEIPLAAITRLGWGGIAETSGSDGFSDFEIFLWYDKFQSVSLPSSYAYRSNRDDLRTQASRLRAFLKPLCPQLEGTLLEQLGGFIGMSHDERKGFVRKKMTDLESILEHATEQSSSMPQGPGQLPELLASLREATRKFDAKRAETGDRQVSVWRYVWPVAVALVGAAIGYYWFIAAK
jgi:hypothetical protein